MKTIKLAISVLVSCLYLLTSDTLTVLAGDINPYEQKVIDVMSSTFEYDGQKYKAVPSYLAQAKAYLASDDVNLTAEQSQEAISYIWANVESAVINGYIEPIGEVVKDQDVTPTMEVTPSPEATATPEISKPAEVTPTQEITATPKPTKEPEATKPPEHTPSPKPATPEPTKSPEPTKAPEVTDVTGGGNITSIPEDAQATQAPSNTPVPSVTEQAQVTVMPGGTNQPQGTITPTISTSQQNDGDSGTSSSDQMGSQNQVIKNTGYNLTAFYVVVIVITVLSILISVYGLRIYLARKHET